MKGYMARFILTAGGTGGHIFPALSVREVLESRGHEVMFVTDRRFLGYMPNPDPRLNLRIIQSATLSGNVFHKVVASCKLLVGITQSLMHLASFRPVAVAGFGGYPSFPMMLAAERTAVPMVIHEQNALMGKANQLFLEKAKAIAISHPEVEGIDPRFKEKLHLTGNPVREAFQALSKRSYAPPKGEEVFQLLVLGGSQGASILGDVVPKAIALLPGDLRARLQITVQCRKEQVSELKAAYEALGLHSAHVSHFYTDVAERMAAAHLLITRAGASTVAELAMLSLPAIFVPFAKAAGDHQTKNAMQLVERGGGWSIPESDFTPDALKTQLHTCLSNPDMLQQASANVGAHANADASERIADLLEKLI